jgi:hypothetical protein
VIGQEMSVMRRSIHRPVIALVGWLVVLSGQARSEDSTRDTIIQGVRDDVRRRILEGNKQPAENAEQTASGAKQQQPATQPEPGGPNQEPAK